MRVESTVVPEKLDVFCASFFSDRVIKISAGTWPRDVAYVSFFCFILFGIILGLFLRHLEYGTWPKAVCEFFHLVIEKCIFLSPKIIRIFSISCSVFSRYLTKTYENINKSSCSGCIDVFHLCSNTSMLQQAWSYISCHRVACVLWQMYSVYVNNFDRATECLNTIERANPAVAAFLTACERQRHCRGLRLRDFLILPVQVRACVHLCVRELLQH